MEKTFLVASLLALSSYSLFCPDLSRPRAMIDPTVLATIDAITIERIDQKTFKLIVDRESEQEEMIVTAKDYDNQFFYDENKSFQVHVGSHGGPIILGFFAPSDGLSFDTSQISNLARQEFFSK